MHIGHMQWRLAIWVADATTLACAVRKVDVWCQHSSILGVVLLLGIFGITF